MAESDQNQSTESCNRVLIIIIRRKFITRIWSSIKHESEARLSQLILLVV